MTTKAFSRGMRAKQRGKALERNPFLKRKGKANARKAEEWAEGWHAAEVQVVSVPSDWQWPPLGTIPKPEAGDYWLRESGLLAMFRPQDLVEYDVLIAEMRCGSVSYVPAWAGVPFDLLRLYVEKNGRDINCTDPGPLEEETAPHPLRWLWSVQHIQKAITYWPPLIVSAYEELIHGTVPKTLSSSTAASGAAEGTGADESE